MTSVCATYRTHITPPCLLYRNTPLNHDGYRKNVINTAMPGFLLRRTAMDLDSSSEGVSKNQMRYKIESVLCNTSESLPFKSDVSMIKKQ